MARILVVEDEGYYIFMIRKALAAGGHNVCVYLPNHKSFTLPPTLAGGEMDLVLINRFLQHGNGWNIFNKLKENDPEIRIMLYVLQECNLASVNWLSASVNEALMCTPQRQRQPVFSNRKYPTPNATCPMLVITSDTDIN